MYQESDYVIHTTFGIGKVLECFGTKKESRVKIFFLQLGEKTLMPNISALTLLSDEDFEEFRKTPDFKLLERINKEDEYKQYKNIEHAIEGFKKEMNTQDFDGKFYLNDERNYKLHFHEDGKKLFGKDVLQKLIKEEDIDELLKNFKAFFGSKYEGNTQNLTHYLEPLKLYESLDTVEKSILFFNALHDVLYSEDNFEERFDKWIEVLSNLGHAKWTIATIFLFIIHPHKYMYVKPETTKNALEISGFYGAYQSRPCYNYYKVVLECSHYIFQKTKNAGMNPKDMIDIQSFMWCIRPSYDNEGRAYK